MLPMLMIGLVKDLRSLVDQEMKDAYMNGFKSDSSEYNYKLFEKKEKY